MRNRNWKLAIGVGAAALVAGGVAGVAGIAAADPTTRSTEYVDGFGDIHDDFNDHHREIGVLGEGNDNASQGSDVVTLWQSILAADGFLTGDQIDGVFDSDSAEATAEWQEANDLDPTGEVDRGTWAAADDKLEEVDEEFGDGAWSENPGGEKEFLIITYTGDEGELVLSRGESGGYDLLEVTDAEGTTMLNATGEGNIWLLDRTIELEADED